MKSEFYILNDVPIRKFASNYYTFVAYNRSQQEIADRYFQLTLDYSKRFMNSFAYLNAKNDVDPPNIHCSLSVRFLLV